MSTTAVQSSCVDGGLLLGYGGPWAATPPAFPIRAHGAPDAGGPSAKCAEGWHG